MSGASNSQRVCFGNFSFVCTTGTLLTAAEITALQQQQLATKVCVSCLSIPGCLCLGVLSYYLCAAYYDEMTETATADLNTALLTNHIPRTNTRHARPDITPMLSALRSNHNASGDAAQDTEDMLRTNLPRARITEG